jgi:hypothetical protein
MTSLRLRATMALGFAALTAACGGGDGTGPSFADSVSTAAADSAADYVAGFASQVAYSINFNGPAIGIAAPAMLARVRGQLSPSAPSLSGAAFREPDVAMLDWRRVVTRAKGLQLAAGAGCTVTMRGSDDPFEPQPTDANGNGIPDDFYLKYVCTEIDSIATDTVITGVTSQEVAIKEISGSLYGQTISVGVHVEQRDNHGRYVIPYHIELSGKQDIRTDGIVDQASIKAREESNLSGEVLFEEAGESWSNAFDPASPISPESNIPDGDLTIGGRRYHADSEGNNISFGISTTDPLAYSAACALADTNPPFSDGTIVGKLNNSSSQASFTIDFTGCGGYTVTVNGAYDEPVVVTARR